MLRSLNAVKKRNEEPVHAILAETGHGEQP
jgi:hypothetical protein